MKIETIQQLYCDWCPKDCQGLTEDEKLGCLASGGFRDALVRSIGSDAKRRTNPYDFHTEFDKHIAYAEGCQALGDELHKQCAEYKRKITEQRPDSYYRDIDIWRMIHVANMIPDGSKVLDVGAYDGLFEEHIDHHCSVTSVDINPQSPRVIRADVTALPFSDNSFDYAVTMETLEHLDDPSLEKAIREIDRVVVKGIVVSVPADEVPLPREHVQRFDRHRLRHLFPEWENRNSEFGGRTTYNGIRKWLGKHNRKALGLWNRVFGDQRVDGPVWYIAEYRKTREEEDES